MWVFRLLLICWLSPFAYFAQSEKTIYFFPGQGSDYRIFDSLRLDGTFNKVFISYPIPKRKTSLKQFAIELSAQIDSTKPFILVGVSLGGMLCSEISEILKPEKVIIISSAKNRSELPFRYKFQRAVPLYRIFPPVVLRGGAKFMQPLVEPDRKLNKATFKSMLRQKNARYIKRTIHMIITWDRLSNSSKIYHIHGTRDHTLPFRKVRNPDVVIRKGSHMMTLTRAVELSAALNALLLL